VIQISDKGFLYGFHLFLLVVKESDHYFLLDVRHNREEDEDFWQEVGKHFSESPRSFSFKAYMNSIQVLLKDY